MFPNLLKFAIFFLPLAAQAAPTFIARQDANADVAAKIDADRLKVVDGLKTADSSLTSVLDQLRQGKDQKLVVPAQAALDNITEAGAAATRIANDLKAGKVPADADQAGVAVAILKAEKNVKDLKEAFDEKRKSRKGKGEGKGKGKGQGKGKKLQSTIDDAAGGVTTAKDAGLEILSLQGKKIEDIIPGAKTPA